MHAGYAQSLPPLSRVASVEDPDLSSVPALQRAMARKASWSTPLGSLPPTLPQKLPSSYSHEFSDPSSPQVHQGASYRMPDGGFASQPAQAFMDSAGSPPHIHNAEFAPARKGAQQVYSNSYGYNPHGLQMHPPSTDIPGQRRIPSQSYHLPASASWANSVTGFAGQQGLAPISSASNAAEQPSYAGPQDSMATFERRQQPPHVTVSMSAPSESAEQKGEPACCPHDEEKGGRGGDGLGLSLQLLYA